MTAAANRDAAVTTVAEALDHRARSYMLNRSEVEALAEAAVAALLASGWTNATVTDEETEPHYVMEVQPDGRLTVEYPVNRDDAVTAVAEALRNAPKREGEAAYYPTLAEAAVAALEPYIAARIAAETDCASAC